MSRYIDADKLIKQFDSLEQLARKRVCDTPTNSPAYERYSTQYCEREKALRIIKAQPTADVVEVVHARWEWKFNLDDDDFYECSVCGRQEVINSLCRDKNPVEHFPFCHCGAKMDGERREG